MAYRNTFVAFPMSLAFTLGLPWLAVRRRFCTVFGLMRNTLPTKSLRSAAIAPINRRRPLVSLVTSSRHNHEVMTLTQNLRYV